MATPPGWYPDPDGQPFEHISSERRRRLVATHRLQRSSQVSCDTVGAGKADRKVHRRTAEITRRTFSICDQIMDQLHEDVAAGRVPVEVETFDAVSSHVKKSSYLPLPEGVGKKAGTKAYENECEIVSTVLDSRIASGELERRVLKRLLTERGVEAKDCNQGSPAWCLRVGLRGGYVLIHQRGRGGDQWLLFYNASGAHRRTVPVHRSRRASFEHVADLVVEALNRHVP